MIPFDSITIIISVCSVAIAFAVFIGNRSKDYGQHEASNATIVTKLDYMSEDLKDIKADQRTYQAQINDIRMIAIRADTKAEAAHNRLDRAGIDTYEIYNEGTD